MSEITSTTDRQALIDHALDLLASVDLDGVRMKLADPKEGKGWDAAMLDRAEHEYRCFLALNFAYPDLIIVPDKTVDEFWHQHILDTRAYANDTVGVFGHFLHHFPYLGTRGPEDEENLIQCYSDTRDLYDLHFGRSETGDDRAPTKCGSGGRCSSCAHVTVR